MEPNRDRKKRMRGNTLMGLLFLLVGGVLLLRQSGYPLPGWLFSWEIIVILVGLFIGIGNRFRDFSWLVLVLIGSIFLVDDVWPDIRLQQYVVPIVIIALGLIFIVAPKRMRHTSCGRRRPRMMPGEPGFAAEAVPAELPKESAANGDPADHSHDDVLDIVSIFGGVKRRVLSKQFSGGDIICIFGGSEINLAHSDFNSRIQLDLVQIFGGVKLVVPANWEVRSEVAAVFGGIDDKRPQPTLAVPEKIIILRGTIIFGGVEVNSY